MKAGLVGLLVHELLLSCQSAALFLWPSFLCPEGGVPWCVGGFFPPKFWLLVFVERDGVGVFLIVSLWLVSWSSIPQFAPRSSWVLLRGYMHLGVLLKTISSSIASAALFTEFLFLMSTDWSKSIPERGLNVAQLRPLPRPSPPPTPGEGFPPSCASPKALRGVPAPQVLALSLRTLA